MIRFVCACLFAALFPMMALSQEAVSNGNGAVLRAVDKLNAKVTDLTLTNGQRASMGLIEVTLDQCRYPVGNPAGDAFAYLTIRESGKDAPIFSGWMVASSPALNPLDHPRYDVWVLRCTTS